MAKWRTIGPIVLFALVPILPLWRTVFLGETVGAFDQVRQMAPWNGPAPERPWDVLQADSVLQFYPWRELVIGAWARGEIPTWNRYQLAGTPLLANSQSGALYPPHVVAGLLHVPTPNAIDVLSWLHLWLAGFGAYLLARSCGAGRAGATVAGVAFQSSWFLMAWTALPSVISTCAWIPWAMALGLRVMDVGSSVGRRWLGGAGLAVVIALMLLAGHLQFAAYGMLGTALVCAWAAVAPARTGERATRRGVAMVGVACACAVGAMLAGPQLVPVLKLGEIGHRKNVPTEDGYRAYVASALQPYELTRIAAPTLQGNNWERVSPEVPVVAYFPALRDRGANFAEGAWSWGPVVLLLALASVRWRPKASWVGIGLVGVIGLLLALGTPLNRLLYFGIPGWSSTGSPGRAEVLFVLSGCVLAGLGMEALKGCSAAQIRRILYVFALVCGVSVAWTLGAFGPILAERLGQLSLRQFAEPALPATLVAFVLAAGALVANRLLSMRAFAIVCAADVVGCAWLLGADRVVPTGMPLPQLETGLTARDRVAALNEDWELLLAAPALLPPNTATLLGIRDLSGYDSLISRETMGLLYELGGVDAAPPANGNMAFIKPSSQPDRLAEAGVTEVWSLRPMEKFGTPVAQWQGVLRYRLPDAPGWVSLERGTVEGLSEAMGRYEVRVNGGGELVVRDRALPGWRATVEGKSTALNSGPWLSVRLDPGRHDVVFTYVPPGLSEGLWLFSVGSTAIVIALGVAGGSARRGGGRSKAEHP